jgi:hypothetical protein
VLIAALLGKAEAEPMWYKKDPVTMADIGGFNSVGGPGMGVADFYQHQNWTFDPTNAAWPYAKTDWEHDGGWCCFVALADVLFDLQTRGYTNLLPSGAGTITNPAQWFNAAYNPADISKSAILMLHNALRPAGMTISTYLTAQGHSPNPPTPPNQQLQALSFEVNPPDGKVKVSARNTEPIFDFYNEHAKFGDELVLKLAGGTVQPVAQDKQGQWWNFHEVAGAGISVANRTVYVADPDSNRGSGLTNAGFPVKAMKTFPGDPPASATSFGLKTAASDPLPLATTAKIGMPNTYNTYYQGFTFTNAAVKGDDPNTVYNGQVVTNIITIGPPPAGKRASIMVPGGFESTIAVSSGAETVDSVWIDPLSTVLDPTMMANLFSFSSSGSTWDVQRTSTDPFDNPVSFGGVEYTLEAGGSGLLSGQDGTALLGTTADFSQFDIFLHFAGDPFTLWDPATIGGPDDTAVELQSLASAPEPSSSLLLLSALLGLGFYRRRLRLRFRSPGRTKPAIKFGGWRAAQAVRSEFRLSLTGS